MTGYLDLNPLQRRFITRLCIHTLLHTGHNPEQREGIELMDGFDFFFLLMFGALAIMGAFISGVCLFSGEVFGVMLGIFFGLTLVGGPVCMCLIIAGNDRP